MGGYVGLALGRNCLLITSTLVQHKLVLSMQTVVLWPYLLGHALARFRTVR